MNNRYLFRGKHVDNGEWVYGYLFGIWEKRFICWGTTDDIPNMTEVTTETVGQSTGLVDRNGTLIYEGDIIKAVIYCVGVPIYDEVETVVFHRGNFDINTFDEMEVIGNIHDKEAENERND